MLEKLKGAKKKIAMLLCACVATVAMTTAAFAEGAGTANADVVSAMTTIANDARATGTAVIPIALGVVGLGMVVVFGIKMFGRVFRKA